jgi:biopolymer transport protein TolQ
VNDPIASLSIVALFLNADVVVKGVLVLLLAASVWSWAVIIDKLWRLGSVSRSARGHEARAAAAQSAQELLATEARGNAGDPAGLMLSAGWAESTAGPSPGAETAGERRERIERAMRLALNAEL